MSTTSFLGYSIMCQMILKQKKFKRFWNCPISTKHIIRQISLKQKWIYKFSLIDTLS